MNDTICAIATPMGSGGIGIVRVSGSLAPSIASQVLGHCPKPRLAEYGEFSDGDGNPIDAGIALYFVAPHSFTGEDVLELQGHGGRVVQELLCERIQELGARLARPGEFTERAFLNDRIDLTQAEAVADLINASNEHAARASIRSLTGEFSREVLAIDREVLDLRAHVEGAIDFAEEEIDFLDDGNLGQRLQAIQDRLAELLRRTQSGVVMQQGMVVVIAGAPNVGKSSLLNALLNADRAIVTDVAGTTRDTLDATVHLEGLPVHLIDTAGMHASEDPIEEAGIERARKAIDQADLVLWVEDDCQPGSSDRPAGNCLVVRNKCDLSGNEAGKIGNNSIRISARYAWGLDCIRDFILNAAGYQAGDDAFAGRPRHLAALRNADSSLSQARNALASRTGEVVAEELRSVHQCLGEVVGDTTTDDLLGEIFSKFCIGK